MSKENNGNTLSLLEQLARECEAMAKHAFASGLKVPADIAETLGTYLEKEKGASPTDGGFKFLVEAHEKLSAIVEPAKPRTILLLHEENKKKGLFHFFGPVPFIRRMTLTAIISLLLFILISLSPQITTDFPLSSSPPGPAAVTGTDSSPEPAAVPGTDSTTGTVLTTETGSDVAPDTGTRAEPTGKEEPTGEEDHKDPWDLFNSSGIPLLIRELFLVCAAALGASFNALFKANQYIMAGTFDPKFESSYWVRFILGIIAGMLLATLIPIEQAVGSGFGKPLLAMLGGYAADVVNKVITRIIETFASLVRGDMNTLIEVQKKEMALRLSEVEIKNRSQMTSKLMELQQQVDSGMAPDEIKGKIKQLMETLAKS